MKLQNEPSILPELVGFTSRPILFVVDGSRYAGHYHMNGYFYVAEYQRYEKSISIARHPQTKNGDFGPLVSSWEYV